MKYEYHDLSPSQFEDLVVVLCQKLLGISVQRFSTGPDGGRDAKFVGTAELFPSKGSPWVGTSIIQAKHCNGFNKSCSELDFFNTDGQNTVIGLEIPRIQALRSMNQLDNYILITNRRLSANTEANIREAIAAGSGLDPASIYICGLEQLDLWLKIFPDVARIANLDPIDSPLVISSDLLAEIVEIIAAEFDGLDTTMDDAPVPRLPYEEKNLINNMGASYAETIRKRYLKDTFQIRRFLAAPENLDILKKYELIVDEFQIKIISKRRDFQSFDEVMEYVINLLRNRDAVLRQQRHSRLTRSLLFYMYWNCDIGETEYA